VILMASRAESPEDYAEAYGAILSQVSSLTSCAGV